MVKRIVLVAMIMSTSVVADVPFSKPTSVEWIDTEDRLPDDHTEILFITAYGVVHGHYFDRTFQRKGGCPSCRASLKPEEVAWWLPVASIVDTGME